MKQTTTQLLETYLKVQRRLRTLNTLSAEEQLTIRHKLKHITDSIIYYNGGLFKIVEKYSSKKVQLSYKLINLSVREFDILEYKNSENKFIRDYYKTELKPKLAQAGIDY